MRNSVYRISLEMHDTASQALLNVKKNDSSRQVRISITDSGKPYKIEDGCTAKFRAKKPDGTILYNNCIIENDVIIYDLTNQTSAAAGLVDCEITLYGADFKQITSPRFAIYVDDTLYSDSEVESKDEFTALVTAEKTAVSAAQSAKEAETNANQSALLAEQYKNEAFKVTPAGFTEFVETTNDTLNEIGNLLGNTDISAIGDGTLTGGLDALNSNLCHKANSKIALEYDGTTENKDFNVLDLFGDTRGIYLISSACDFYKASYGVWIVGLSKSTDQTFITKLSGTTASLTINLDRTLTFNANYQYTQHYVVNVIKLA
ncbi:MAG: BppU family phage baseplate upper protein [Acetatifactor sp.]